MKKLITLLLITCIFSLFTGCPEPEPDFVGTWIYSGSAEMEQIAEIDTEGYTATVIVGENEGSITADILEYDEAEGHIRAEITSVNNMGDWVEVGDIQYITYRVNGNTMLITDNFRVDSGNTYPDDSLFDTGTEGYEYLEFTRE